MLNFETNLSASRNDKPRPEPQASGAPPEVGPANPRWQQVAMQSSPLGVQTKPAAADSPTGSPGIGAGFGPGAPLESGIRGFFEPRFDEDFSQVRVHTGPEADASARNLDARAFTLGSSVVFRSGNYAPHSDSGRHLLAHELAHVSQQHDGPGAESISSVSSPEDTAEREADIATESVFAGRGVTLACHPPPGQALRDTKEYETAGILLDSAKMTEWASRSYWEQKVLTALAVTTVSPAGARLAAAEERDAVFSVIWNLYQTLKPVTAEKVRAVTIPARSAKAPALSYSFTFRAPAGKDKRERVEVRFEAEGAGAAPVAATSPTAAVSSPPGLMVSNFPDKNNSAKWFKRFPAEQAQLFAFIAGGSLPAGGQILTTSSPLGKKLHQTTFAVTPGSGGPTIEFVVESTPTTASPPAGYTGHDYADLQLEEPGKDKAVLGKITLPTGMPADEVIPVKYTIWQYFQGGTRNAEVDAIVPIPGATPKRVFYTLKFHGRTNAVDALRLGEEGKAGDVVLAKLTFDLSRIPDYPAHSKTVAALSAWIKKRYPAIAPRGADVATMKSAAEADIASGVIKNDWFKNNYGMEELNAAGASTRLQTVQHWDLPQAKDTKDFTPDERRLLERALETLSDPLVALLMGVPLARQKVFIKKGGTTKRPTYTAQPKTSGDTAISITTSGGTSTVDRTVVLFDNWFLNDTRLFTGDAGTIAPASMPTPLHEFGHVIEDQAGIKAAFEKKFTASKAAFKTAPITWYAKSDPAQEFFAEAFALFHADPGWMRANLPNMFSWFQTLSSTGKPPP